MNKSSRLIILSVICWTVFTAALSGRFFKFPKTDDAETGKGGADARKISLELEERTVIPDFRGPGDAPYQVGSNLAFDSSDHVYLTEIQDSVILKFDENGKFLTAIGRRGQGPGEFQAVPYRFFVDPLDHLYVLDNAKLIKFDAAGRFMENIPMEWGVYDFLVGRDGRIFFVTLEYQPKGSSWFVKTVGETGEKKDLLSFPAESSASSSGVHLSIKGPASDKVELAPCFPEGFYTGNTQMDTLYFFNLRGQEIRQLKITRSREKLTAGEKEKIRETMKKMVRNQLDSDFAVPEYKPFFRRILCDENGWLFVFHDVKEKIVADMFDKEGKLRYQAEFPVLPLVFRKGSFYAFANKEDEGGNVIYRLKRWIVRTKIT